MDRLTDKNFRIGFDDSDKLPSYVSIYERLRECEDLEEQGKLLKLPCAAGDTVWCVHMYSGGGRVPNWGEIFQSKFTIGMYDDFNKTVFLTKSAAEQALKAGVMRNE